MSFPYKNPISPIQVNGTQSVSRNNTYGTTFSVNNIGGYMEVFSLSDLYYTIPSGTTGSIEYSGNTIPIEFTKGTGAAWSPDVITLASDNISSGRRRLGMLVYVYEEDQVYQYYIDNYETLFNAATASTGCAQVSNFGTTINNKTAEGQSFINAWTGNTIEDVSGATYTTAVWRKFSSGGGGGGVGGEYLPLSGGTVTGNTYYTSGLTANTLTVTGLTQTSGITSTGGITFKQVTINSSYTATTSDYMIDVTGGTFSVVLPSAIGIQGRLLVVKNNGGGAVTVQPVLGQNIDDKPFVILGETNTIQLASNGLNWVAISYNISTVNSSTGVFVFTGLSIASTTTFNVAPVKGWIVDDTTNPLSPQLYYVAYSGGTHTATYVNTATETWVYLTSGGTVSQSNIELTEQQRRQNIFLGKLGHANKTNIINAFSQPDFVLSPLSQLRDMFAPIGLINQGIYPSANGVNLSFNTSAGYLHGLGINFANDTLSPNEIYVTGTSPCTFQYRTQTGGTASNTTFIDPTKWDVGGVVTSITGTKATNQRIYLVQNGIFRVQYGQTEYNQLSAAIEGIATEQFNTFSNFTNNGILIGVLSVLSTATDLSDTSKARFFFTSKFGETVGAAGGVATTTLQQAYNNSAEPEITTNSTLNAFGVRNGTGNADNVTNLFEGQNTAGNVTSFIRADGAFSGTSISATSISTPFTTGSVIFQGSGGTLSQNNSNFFWDNTNSRMGFGTSSPLVSLDVRTSNNSAITPLSVVPNDATTLLVGNTGTNGVLALGHNNTGQGWIQGRSRLGSGASEPILLNPLGGNILVGTTTDAGYLLDVNGTSRLNGLSSINGVGVANTALAIYANGTGGGNYIINAYDSGLVQRFYVAASGNFRIAGATDTGTSGSDEKMRLTLTFSPTSGNREHYGHYITQTINQTGGASGVTRGIYITPTLTSAYDYRAIETTIGNVMLNTVSGNTLIGTTANTGTYKLDVRGATRLSASTGTSLTVISSGNSTSVPVFSVQGSQGELFSVTDSLTGSLFSVSDISGLPIMEVFSDSTIILGDYQAPSLYTTKRVSSITATTGTTIYSFPTSAYTSSFVDYYVSGSTGLRAGNIMAIWSGSSVNFTETSTNDLGSTTPVTFGYVMSGSSAVLRASASTGTWIVESIVRGL